MNHLMFSQTTYIEHFIKSMTYSFKCIKAGYYFFIHAINPNVYETSGYDCIKELNGVILEDVEYEILFDCEI